ncbi:unnamed protein product [Miscanthus lutarioriparius]|uniref:Rhodanese domain-containing protein n=1 Tax=Miscanthus lutarioriparius TaxID=422564 RepID=A0A811QS53_9POAL|nr:unnamed protein product [Miscanthus lutarioriparius]
MRPAILLTICTLSVLLLVARGSEKPSPAPVVAVGVAAASDLIRSGAGTEKNTQFIAQVAADFDKEDNIVVGCKSGVRSELACADLMAAGFRNVKNIEGGYTAWVENGLAVKKSQAQDEL